MTNAPRTEPVAVVATRRRRASSARTRCVLVAIVLFAAGEARLDPVRWWRSPRVVVALGLTSAQCDELDRVYAELVPAGQTASLDVMRLTERVADSIRDGTYDDKLLAATAALVRSREEQCELHHQAFAKAAAALFPDQRRRLARLVAARQIVE